MHPLLKVIILNPDSLTKYKNSDDAKAQKIYRLTRKSPQGLLYVLIANYLHRTAEIAIDAADRVPTELVSWAESLDHLYYEVAELYKEATGKVPPTMQTVVVNGGTPVRIKHSRLDVARPPLVLFHDFKIDGDVLTIDPSQFSVTIVHSE